MDLQRLFLFLIFSLSVFLLWDGWQRTQHSVTPVTVETGSVPTSAQTPKVSSVPATMTENRDASVAAVQQKSSAGQKITVKTNWLIAELSTAGGDLRRLKFLQQFDAKDRNKPFVLLQEQEAHTYIAQTGLLGSGLPTHNADYTTTSNEYQLAEGQEVLEVRLQAAETNVAKVNKVYTFHRSSYLIDVAYEIENGGNAPLSSSAYFQFVRDKTPPEGGSKFVPTYTGPAIYTEQGKFQKVDFSDIDKGKVKFPQNANDGWIGMLQHYFVAAWLPGDKTQREFYIKPLENGLYSAGVILPISAIAPGQKAKINVPLYAGPAQTSLDKIAPGLGLTVDYGWLTILSTPLFWVLSLLQGWVQNWGIAIILLTVLIKLVFFPLSAASYRSMAKMRVVAPKLEKIKQQYGEDRERLHKAMMELYKTEKINPLGGCLPMLIQIPVFIALYWAILSSVELRYAPFFGWINDLSAADPYYILPLIMGASMIIQSKLSPAPPDPMQAKVMQIMPVVFSIVFFFFPAGLVLYSITNNGLSIAQQWYITRRLEAGTKGVAA
ncbi:MAG: membrane protein insertase YidC [Nitrosomonadales bacterium]|nr:membrane protein insertase YidC [Nitrosomonadales bacterium]